MNFLSFAWLLATCNLALCIVNSFEASQRRSQTALRNLFKGATASYKPRFRYVVPEASVDPQVVAQDIAEIAKVEAGGIELLGYPGGVLPQIDWTINSWGGQAWREITKAALRATKELGLILDVAIGPFQGAGTPAPYDDVGIMWDLLAFNVSVRIGSSYDAILPGWGSGEFVSASIGLVTNSTPVNLTGADGYYGRKSYNGTSYTLAASSLRDISDSVTSDGHLNIRVPQHLAGQEYHLFAFYQIQTRHRELEVSTAYGAAVPQSPIITYVENGSWIADHFSTAGADMIINFWETHELDDEMRELLKEVGNYAWEDSYEIGVAAHLWYTPRLLDEFHCRRSYRLNKFLPLLYSTNTAFNGPLASINQYFTDDVDRGMQHIQDYRRTLTELNRAYLERLTQWSHSLGMKFSSQVLYNLPLDVLANVPFVDVPEGESLGFSDEIDLYRQYSTPSSLAGKAVISNELGATQSKAYSQTMPDLLWSMKRSIAGSVNNFILHIYPFSGQYYNTTWPGYTTFTYLFSGMNGPRQPSWAFFSDISGWMARSHYVSQQGTAKLDIVFWLNQQAGLSLDDGYSDGDLEDAGFTYGYFSPANLDLPTSYVEDKIFAPSTISSKALVLRSDSILTPEGVSKLVQYAQAGLCVVFDGDIPRGFAGAVSSQTQKSALRSLSNTLKLPNVHQFTTGSLADNLQKVGIEPRTRVRMTRTIHTHWREDDDSCFTFVSVFNDGFADVLGEGLAEGEIEFETLGSPYVYDAWTGEVSPVREFTQTGLHTVVPMRLRGNESSVIVFHRGPKAQGDEAGYHDFERPSECGWTEAQRALFRQLPSSAPRIAVLPPAENIQLNKWTLNVEAWLAPTNLTSLEPLITTTTYNLTDLLPWHKISESLRNVSGRGTYSTTFEWQRGYRYGAKLDLGALLDVSRAWINGHQLAPLDPAKPVADLTEFLVYGQNVITIVVTTSLANSLRPVWSQLMSGGVGNMGPLPTLQDYGLVLPVIVEPYEVICC